MRWWSLALGIYSHSESEARNLRAVERLMYRSRGGPATYLVSVNQLGVSRTRAGQRQRA